MKDLQFPVGISNFEKIREGGYYYIDKTNLISELLSGGIAEVTLITRPRRFGKSLLSSTLHSYFAGEKDLFKGLAIEGLEKEWTEYPVLHFDMSTFKNCDLKDLQFKFRKLIKYNVTT